MQSYDPAKLVLHAGVVSALAQHQFAYPVFRKLSFSIQYDYERYCDELALNLGWSALRTDGKTLLLHTDGLFIEAYVGSKSDYCRCSFRIWADSVAGAKSAKAIILEHAADKLITRTTFFICWSFLGSGNALNTVTLEELADDVLHDAAYPEMDQGVARFITDYLDAPETVLVIQGSPGNGKTRLIRAILGEMSRRKGRSAEALYTTDKKVFESDEIFMNFITGTHDAFIVEDADYLLRPREDSNDNLHRFLGIADGVIRAQGRKIIFSTNLRNLEDIDEALIRPGRCFARIKVRELSVSDAHALLVTLSEGDLDRITAGMQCLSRLARQSYSVAEVYRIHRDSAAKG